MNTKRINAVSLAIVAALLPVGCAQEQQAPLAGARIGGSLAGLIDQDGRAVRGDALAGKYRIMYFGYTFCPDVCPVDVQMIGAGLRAFERADPARAAKVVPVFVTVDPARDTPGVLKTFVANFHPRMIGLTGTVPQIKALAKGYGFWFELGELQPGGGYLVNHARTAYLMGPQGQPIALLPNEGPPQAIADDLMKWVK